VHTTCPLHLRPYVSGRNDVAAATPNMHVHHYSLSFRSPSDPSESRSKGTQWAPKRAHKQLGITG
jgi:hypothetical protein